MVILLSYQEYFIINVNAFVKFGQLIIVLDISS